MRGNVVCGCCLCWGLECGLNDQFALWFRIKADLLVVWDLRLGMRWCVATLLFGNDLSIAYIRNMKQYSVSQYAALVGKSRQWILWLIIHDRSLAGVTKVEKVGRAYVITMN